MSKPGIRSAVIVLGLVAAVGLAVSSIAIRAAGNRSDRIDGLADDLAAVHSERDDLAGDVERLASRSAVIESRWLAAVAVGGNFSPSESRLLAVESAARSATPESAAALGQLLFADARSDPPIIELAHDGPVWVTGAAAVTDIVATGSDDTTAKVWSTTGELVATLAHEGQVRALDFSADGQRIATGAVDGAVTSWTASGEVLSSARHADQVNDVVIGGDGALTVSGGHDGVALVADAETGEVRHTLQHPDIVWSVAVTGDGRVATGGQDGRATVWDLETGTELVSYEVGQPVTTVAFSPDGGHLFAGGQGGTAILVESGAVEAGPRLDGTFRGGVVDIDWHPSETELAVVSLGGINRYDLSTGALIAEHRLAGGARGVAYSPDGTWFATGSGDFQFNFGQITFWDTSTGTELAGLNLGGPVESISVHATGTVLAGFRTTEDLIEIGGAWLVPGPDAWVALACEGTDGTLSEQTWSGLTGESGGHRTSCP